MAISVQHVVVLLLSTLLITITVLFLTSDNSRFPFPSLSPTDYYRPNSKSPIPQNVSFSFDQISQNKQKLNPSQEVEEKKLNESQEVEEKKLNDSQEVEELKWDLCTGAESVDYIPCLDNYVAIKQLKSRRHMEHRERHCPAPSPKCLVPLPDNYRPPIPWPKSRDMIWYDNVPHPKLVEYKKEQNWVKKTGEYLVFPGGGTQFKFGVTHYVEFIEKALPSIQWGKNIRVVLDVGCGVASFGGFLLDKDVITMSFAPKDEHEAQIQFALERGIPATLSVIGTQQLTFPSNAFDLIHCARCRVHWDADGGKPLLELNRVLRPGGFFIWSATPVYRDNDRDTRIWNAMVSLTKSICWKVVTKTVDSSGIVLVIYQKPTSESCYNKRSEQDPPLCDKKEANASWYVPLAKCISKIPSRNIQSWPEIWPKRVVNVKPQSIAVGAETIKKDTEKWSAIVSDVYLKNLAVNWSSVRNVMDMNAGYGSFAAALINLPLWVMNVVPVDKPDTLSVIYDRGLIGVYHDWCESLNTYPRTYDLLHSSFYLGDLALRCEIYQVTAEIDRVVRPGGYLVVQDTMEVLQKLESIVSSLHWSTKIYEDRFLVGRKGFWRPAKPEV